jgi:hypothetical protein
MKQNLYTVFFFSSISKLKLTLRKRIAIQSITVTTCIKRRTYKARNKYRKTYKNYLKSENILITPLADLHYTTKVSQYLIETATQGSTTADLPVTK